MFESQSQNRQEKLKNTWKAPSVEELEGETNHLIPHNITVVRNVLLYAAGKMKRTQCLSDMDMRDFFSSPFASRFDFDFSREIEEDTTKIFLEEHRREAQSFFENPLNQDVLVRETMRAREAMDYLRSLPDEVMPNMGGDSGLTNIYPHKEDERLPTPEAEESMYRVNLATESHIEITRVAVDIYKELCDDPVLMHMGFKMKARPGYMDDNIIVYCGKRGLPSALQIVGNYCIREQIGITIPGVPFGMCPLEYDGVYYKGLSITSHFKSNTFNGLQASALRAVLEKIALVRGDKDLTHLSQETIDYIKKGLDGHDPAFIWLLEDKYEEALEERGVKSNHHNIAFSR